MSDPERATMPRKLWVFIIGVSVISAVFLLPFVIRTTSPLGQFVRKDTNYYAQIGRACDLILQQHPLGTNIGQTMSGSDKTVPQIIRDLHPRQIVISSEPSSVWFPVGQGRLAFGVAWEHRGSNFWVLKTIAENRETTVYTETR
jgi:hypothetical protein